MKGRIVYCVIAFLIWLGVTWSIHYQSVVAGLAVVILSAVLFGGYFTSEPRKFLQPHRWVWFLAYLPVFLWYMFRANVDVAYRVLHPERPINPGIVKIRTVLKTDIGRTFLANSITLTPGTMTAEVDGEYLYIHWIDVRSTDIDEASKIIARPFERFLTRIFE